MGARGEHVLGPGGAAERLGAVSCLERLGLPAAGGATAAVGRAELCSAGDSHQP